MTYPSNLSGRTFYRLTVIGEAKRRNDKRHWNCECSCGNKTIVAHSKLTTGHTRSCGCYKLERISETKKTHGRTTGKERDRTYDAWGQMKARCTSNTSTRAERYIVRGIKFAKRWAKFENFLADMGECPSAKHSLERIDNDGNYGPGNCKWATSKEQGRNKRNNRLFEYAGESLTAGAMVEKHNPAIKEKTFAARVNRYGWSVARALFEPPHAWKYKR